METEEDSFKMAPFLSSRITKEAPSYSIYTILMPTSRALSTEERMKSSGEQNPLLHPEMRRGTKLGGWDEPSAGNREDISAEEKFDLVD